MTVLIKSNSSGTQNTSQQESFKYYKEFQSFYGPWSSSKFIGGGIKNFRFYCHKEEYKINQSGTYDENYCLSLIK